MDPRPAEAFLTHTPPTSSLSTPVDPCRPQARLPRGPGMGIWEVWHWPPSDAPKGPRGVSGTPSWYRKAEPSLPAPRAVTQRCPMQSPGSHPGSEWLDLGGNIT